MRLILPLLLASFVLSSHAAPAPQDQFEVTITPAKTLRLLNDNTPVSNLPNGEIIDHWNGGTLFTSNKEHQEWIQVTGHFPDKVWQPMPTPTWINKQHIEDISAPPLYPRDKGSKRYILIDKTTFELKVIDQSNGIETQRYTTNVGLGMDGCLTADEGGKCYYTEAGEYQVRWKVYDPDGIEWCVPKDMEKEKKYAKDIAEGKRCYQGALGRFALNIGKTYAIHGTTNNDSIGKNASHGCVRARNDEMETIWRYMEVGDKVIIIE